MLPSRQCGYRAGFILLQGIKSGSGTTLSDPRGSIHSLFGIYFALKCHTTIHHPTYDLWRSWCLDLKILLLLLYFCFDMNRFSSPFPRRTVLTAQRYHVCYPEFNFGATRFQKCKHENVTKLPKLWKNMWLKEMAAILGFFCRPPSEFACLCRTNDDNNPLASFLKIQSFR